jgi:hypothetical protein
VSPLAHFLSFSLGQVGHPCHLPPFCLCGRAGAAPVHPRLTRACGMGRPHRLAGPHAKRPVRALGSIPPGGAITLLPPCRAPQWHGLRGGGGCHLARPGGQTGGNRGISHHLSALALPHFKGGRRVETLAVRATNPIGVFFPLSSVCAVREEEWGGSEEGKASTWRRASPSPKRRGGEARSRSYESRLRGPVHRDAPGEVRSLTPEPE